MVTVIGCGNILAGDDGIGVYLVRELNRTGLPAGVSVIEAGTPGLNFLDVISDKDKVIIVDAVKSVQKGRVFWMKEDGLLKEDKNFLSLHGIGLSDALRLGRKAEPEMMPGEVWIFGVGIETAQSNLGLSPELKKLLPRLTTELVQKIKDVA
jgi:hydrogenase maturation protease